MSALTNLKLVTAKHPMHLSPVVQRRNKVIARIFEQIQLAKAAQDGTKYAPLLSRVVVDKETGESKTVEVAKRIKEWWFTTDAGKLCVSIKYGTKVIELGAKGKTAVELAGTNELVATLETLKQAVENGELDAAIESVSSTIKSTLKR